MLLSLAPVPSNVEVARSKICDYARAAGMEPTRRHDVGVAVSEAVTNAFTAHRQAGSSHCVTLAATADGRDTLEVTVVDRGPEFVPLSEAECSREALQQNGSREGGLGVILMRALADDIEFSQDEGMVVRMRFMLPPV